MAINTLWERRIESAIKAKRRWENKFRCSLLEEYYEGFQWKNKIEKSTVNYNPYAINLFYSTIKIKLASLLFQCPKYVLSPRPGNSEWDMDFAVQSAELKQDVLNTIVGNPNTFFVDNLKLATLDSFFRFAILEYGWAADWRNPQKEDLELKSWNDADVTEEKDRVVNDSQIPINERFYVKHIPAKSFIVGISDATELRDIEWCGYCEYKYTSQLKNIKELDWPDDADSQYISRGDVDFSDIDSDDIRRLRAEGSVSKIWHIFDNVAKERKLFLEGHFNKPLWKEDMQYFPLVDHRWDFRLSGWYPIPPTFQWISSQDEINESREQTRSYRRRFTRKFQVLKDTVDQEEIEKFTSGPDGVLVEIGQVDGIRPIMNPDQGQTEVSALIVAKDDFNIISGTSSEARGVSDRTTATQAKLVDVRSRIRESADQLDYTTLLAKIGRGLLVCAQQRLTTGMWIKMVSNPNEQALTDMQARQPVFKYITSQDLSDGYDFDVDVSIENATPAAMEEDFQDFSKFVGMLQNFPMLAMSPTLIRETAFRCNYRNEKVIQQMQQVAIAAMAAKAQAAQQQGQMAAAGVSSNTPEQTQTAQMQQPNPGQIGQQIQQQLGIQ